MGGGLYYYASTLSLFFFLFFSARFFSFFFFLVRAFFGLKLKTRIDAYPRTSHIPATTFNLPMIYDQPYLLPIDIIIIIVTSMFYSQILPQVPAAQDPKTCTACVCPVSNSKTGLEQTLASFVFVYTAARGHSDGTKL